MKTFSIILFALFLTLGSFAQSKSIIKCTIWKPTSFCNIPDSLITTPRVIKMDSTTVVSIPCEKIDKMNNMTGVWLTISKKDGSTLRLESNFKNISLIKRTSGTSIHPYALLWPEAFENEVKRILEYISSDLKTKKFEAKFSFQKKIDLLLIFPDAEKGDKLIIDNFIEAEIK